MKGYLEDNLDARLRDVLPVIQDRIMTQTTYFGVPTLKNPFDFWVYQELIHRTRPTLIIEIGNNCGGSALALAHLLDMMQQGRLVAVDIDHGRLHPDAKAHPRITWIEGDAVAVAPEVAALVEPGDRVMIIEDSLHTYENTVGVLDAYADLVAPACYFVVEDGICHHGLEVGPNPGPYEAVEEFLRRDDRFELDRSQESFLVTWNPKGFLVRK
jgi:cephalosporin hydroxylase